MPLCKYCKQKIDWVKTKTGKFLAVENDDIGYNDCKTGDLLITLTGDSYRVDENSSYPNVRGRLCHTPLCTGRKEIFGRE